MNRQVYLKTLINSAVDFHNTEYICVYISSWQVIYRRRMSDFEKVNEHRLSFRSMFEPVYRRVGVEKS